MAVKEYITKTRKAIETMMEDIRYIRRVNDYLEPRLEEYNHDEYENVLGGIESMVRLSNSTLASLSVNIQMSGLDNTDPVLIAKELCRNNVVTLPESMAERLEKSIDREAKLILEIKDSIELFIKKYVMEQKEKRCIALKWMQFLHETSCYNIDEHKDEYEAYGYIKSFVTECYSEELDFAFETCMNSIYRHILGAGDKDSRQLALYTRNLKKTNLKELRKLIESFVDGILEEKKKPLSYSVRVKMK
jgi:hypothetical protein